MSDNPKSELYKKIMQVQCNLFNHKFNKSGHNQYGKFDYFELEDILPVVVKECFKNDLIIKFAFCENEALLKIRDIGNPGVIVTNRIPFPEVEELPRMNIVQSLGSYLTYAKRYLLLNSFHICEDSYIDSDTFTENKNEEKKKSKGNTNTTKKQRVYPQTVEEHLEFFEKNIKEEGKEVNRQNMFIEIGKYKKRNKEFSSIEKDVKSAFNKKFPINGGK